MKLETLPSRTINNTDRIQMEEATKFKIDDKVRGITVNNPFTGTITGLKRLGLEYLVKRDDSGGWFTVCQSDRENLKCGTFVEDGSPVNWYAAESELQLIAPVPKESIYEEAIRRYPPGTKFRPAHIHAAKDTIYTVKGIQKFTETSTGFGIVADVEEIEIWLPCIRSTGGEWAPIVSATGVADTATITLAPTMPTPPPPSISSTISMSVSNSTPTSPPQPTYKVGDWVTVTGQWESGDNLCRQYYTVGECFRVTKTSGSNVLASKMWLCKDSGSFIGAGGVRSADSEEIIAILKKEALRRYPPGTRVKALTGQVSDPIVGDAICGHTNRYQVWLVSQSGTRNLLVYASDSYGGTLEKPVWAEIEELPKIKRIDPLDPSLPDEIKRSIVTGEPLDETFFKKSNVGPSWVDPTGPCQPSALGGGPSSNSYVQDALSLADGSWYNHKEERLMREFTQRLENVALTIPSTWPWNKPEDSLQPYYQSPVIIKKKSSKNKLITI